MDRSTLPSSCVLVEPWALLMLTQSLTLTSTTRPCTRTLRWGRPDPYRDPAQKKDGGRKLVVTMSSIGGCMGRSAEESRDPQKPLGFGDGIFLAYKASKTALNQGTCRSHQAPLQLSACYSCTADRLSDRAWLTISLQICTAAQCICMRASGCGPWILQS